MRGDVLERQEVTVQFANGASCVVSPVAADGRKQQAVDYAIAVQRMRRLALAERLPNNTIGDSRLRRWYADCWLGAGDAEVGRQVSELCWNSAGTCTHRRLREAARVSESAIGYRVLTRVAHKWSSRVSSAAKKWQSAGALAVALSGVRSDSSEGCAVTAGKSRLAIAFAVARHDSLQLGRPLTAAHGIACRQTTDSSESEANIAMGCSAYQTVP